MPPVRLTRRAFLAAGGSAFILAACGGSGGSDSSSNGKGLSALLLASDLYASPTPQRIAFALSDGGKFASGPRANLAFGAQGKALGRPVDTVLHDRGLPKRRGIYTADVTRTASLAQSIRSPPQGISPTTPRPRRLPALGPFPFGEGHPPGFGSGSRL